MDNAAAKAIEAIQTQSPGSKDHIIARVINGFFNGKLVSVKFKTDKGTDLSWYYYHSRLSTELFRHPEDLVTFVSRNSSRVSLHNLFSFSGISGIIAIVITFVIVYIVVKDPSVKIPDVLQNALTTILGFYFGTAVSNIHKANGPKSTEIE